MSDVAFRRRVHWIPRTENESSVPHLSTWRTPCRSSPTDWTSCWKFYCLKHETRWFTLVYILSRTFNTLTCVYIYRNTSVLYDDNLNCWKILQEFLYVKNFYLLFVSYMVLPILCTVDLQPPLFSSETPVFSKYWEVSIKNQF